MPLSNDALLFIVWILTSKRKKVNGNFTVSATFLPCVTTFFS
jgi:hypothetical protein